MAVSQISNPANAFGAGKQFDQIVEEWINDDVAITKGFVVAANTVAGHVLLATTVVTQAVIQVGVAAEPIAASATGLIITQGNTDQAIADYSNPAAGDLLTIPASTTGRLGKLTVASSSLGQVIGVVFKGATQAAGVAIPAAYIGKM